MFDRFTEHARRAMTQARDEALRARHDCIGSEHVLLGILGDDGVASRALGKLGVDLERCRAETDRVSGRGPAKVEAAQLPFTPRVKHVLEQALAEAQALGHGHIGSEHLLLALAEERDGPAFTVLRNLGAGREAVRREVGALLGGPSFPVEEAYLAEAISRLRMVKGLGDRALAQVERGRWFEALGPDENSLAVVMKHLAGNMRSRWTDFLTTDGEKPDRHRDREFEVDAAADTAEAVLARWEEGWALCFAALEGLHGPDLGRTVTIRGEPHTVLQAVNRQVSHYSYHVGQMVLLARHFAGAGWKSLSIPKGKSKEFEVDREGKPYRKA